jgi:hypothetical protein
MQKILEGSHYTSNSALPSLWLKFVPLRWQWAFWRLAKWDFRQVEHEPSQKIILWELILFGCTANHLKSWKWQPSGYSLEISHQQTGKKKRFYSQIPRMALPPISRCPFLWSYVKINLKANAISSSLVWNLLTPNYRNKRKSINDRLPTSKLQISSQKPIRGFWKKVEGAKIASPMNQYALKFPCSLECGIRT